jgi:hypothetical protein
VRALGTGQTVLHRPCPRPGRELVRRSGFVTRPTTVRCSGKDGGRACSVAKLSAIRQPSHREQDLRISRHCAGYARASSSVASSTSSTVTNPSLTV